MDTQWGPYLHNFVEGCFVPSLVKIGKVVLKRKFKRGENYVQIDRRSDLRLTKCNQLSSIDLSAQVSYNKNRCLDESSRFAFPKRK